MTRLDEIGQELKQALETDLVQYEGLANGLREQIHMLSRGLVEDLRMITASVEDCNRDLMASEGRRRELLRAFAQTSGREQSGLSLRIVAEQCASVLNGELQQLGLRLRLKLREVVRLREQATNLLQKESRFNRERLDWLVEQTREDGYRPDGRKQSRVTRHVIDRKA